MLVSEITDDDLPVATNEPLSAVELPALKENLRS